MNQRINSPSAIFTGRIFALTHLFYRPQTKFAKAMFLHLSVILFTGESTWAGTHPSRYTPPRAGTPPWAGTPPPAGTLPQHLHPPQQCMLGYGQQAGITHPTGMHSCNIYKCFNSDFLSYIFLVRDKLILFYTLCV